MYEPGLLKLLDPLCKSADADGWCDEEWDGSEGHKHIVFDSRTKGKDYRRFVAPEICLYLPHSCDEWVIGGEEQIMQLIEDLKAALLIIEKQ